VRLGGRDASAARAKGLLRRRASDPEGSASYELGVQAMNDIESTDARPYHHGGLGRALVDAACRLLEAEGPSALSLRAVAREAGVSPAAPYHHFKDKADLLDAVAQVGWDRLQAKMAEARANGPGAHPLVTLGAAYVWFARDNPALYRVMYDAARDRAALPPEAQGDNDSGYRMVRDALVESGADPTREVHLELATIAAWCVAHGLAEMSSFRQFDASKVVLGGERTFIDAVLGKVRPFRGMRDNH